MRQAEDLALHAALAVGDNRAEARTQFFDDGAGEAMAQRSTGKEPNSVATGGALMRERFIGTAPGKATSKANVGFWQTSLPQCE